MKERRKYGRFPVQKTVQFLVDGGERTWEECTIVDTSREGMRIRFHTAEKIKVGSNIRLKTLVHGAGVPIEFAGRLIWIERSEGEYIGGFNWHNIKVGG